MSIGKSALSIETFMIYRTRKGKLDGKRRNTGVLAHDITTEPFSSAPSWELHYSISASAHICYLSVKSTGLGVCIQSRRKKGANKIISPFLLSFLTWRMSFFTIAGDNSFSIPETIPIYKEYLHGSLISSRDTVKPWLGIRRLVLTVPLWGYLGSALPQGIRGLSYNYPQARGWVSRTWRTQRICSPCAPGRRSTPCRVVLHIKKSFAAQQHF